MTAAPIKSNADHTHLVAFTLINKTLSVRLFFISNDQSFSFFFPHYYFFLQSHDLRLTWPPSQQNLIPTLSLSLSSPILYMTPCLISFCSLYPFSISPSSFVVSMARLITLLVLFFVLSSSLFSCSEGRKLHVGAENIRRNVSPSSRESLFLSALHKGTVPSSTPSRKGHAVVVDEKLIARHLIIIDRFPHSVPSPGAGH